MERKFSEIRKEMCYVNKKSAKKIEIIKKNQQQKYVFLSISTWNIPWNRTCIRA